MMHYKQIYKLSPAYTLMLKLKNDKTNEFPKDWMKRPFKNDDLNTFNTCFSKNDWRRTIK